MNIGLSYQHPISAKNIGKFAQYHKRFLSIYLFQHRIFLHTIKVHSCGSVVVVQQKYWNRFEMHVFIQFSKPVFRGTWMIRLSHTPLEFTQIIREKKQNSCFQWTTWRPLNGNRIRLNTWICKANDILAYFWQCIRKRNYDVQM